MAENQENQCIRKLVKAHRVHTLILIVPVNNEQHACTEVQVRDASNCTEHDTENEHMY